MEVIAFVSLHCHWYKPLLLDAYMAHCRGWTTEQSTDTLVGNSYCTPFLQRLRSTLEASGSKLGLVCELRSASQDEGGVRLSQSAGDMRHLVW